MHPKAYVRRRVNVNGDVPVKLRLRMNRSSDQQDDFLLRARFGESGKARYRIPVLVKIGLILYLLALACITPVAFLGVGRDDLGPLYLLGAIALFVVGTVACLWGIIAHRRSR